MDDYCDKQVCGITDESLKSCINIRELNARCNSRITTCEPFADSLEILDISNYCISAPYIYPGGIYNHCGITDDGLKKCKNIKILCTDYNDRVTTCEPFAASLVHLEAMSGDGYMTGIWGSNICDDGLALCTSIKKLYIDNTMGITTCAPFAKSLEILYACTTCSIPRDDIELCTNLKYMSYGKYVQSHKFTCVKDGDTYVYTLI